MKLSIKDEQDALGPKLQAANDSATRVILIISLIALLVCVFVSFILTRIITKPLNEGVNIADRLSKGDLTMDIKVPGKDEMGQLMLAMM